MSSGANDVLSPKEMLTSIAANTVDNTFGTRSILGNAKQGVNVFRVEVVDIHLRYVSFSLASSRS